MRTVNYYRQTLKITITAALLIAIGVSVVIGIYFFFPAFRLELKFVSVVLGAGAALYAAYYTGLNVKLLHEAEKRHRAFEMVSRIDEISTIRNRNLIEAHIIPDNMSQKEVYETVVSDPELQSSATHLLNRIEDLSIAIQEGYVDEGVTFRSLHYLVVSNYERLRGYLKEMRTCKKHDTLFIQTERLATRWREQTSVLDGRRLTHDIEGINNDQ